MDTILRVIQFRNPKTRRGLYSSKLSNDDLELIETLKVEKGSTSLKEIYQLLEQFAIIPNNTARDGAKAVITCKFRVQKNLFDATPTKVIIAKQKVLIDKLCQKERFKT